MALSYIRSHYLLVPPLISLGFLSATRRIRVPGPSAGPRGSTTRQSGASAKPLFAFPFHLLGQDFESNAWNRRYFVPVARLITENRTEMFLYPGFRWRGPYQGNQF